MNDPQHRHAKWFSTDHLNAKLEASAARGGAVVAVAQVAKGIVELIAMLVLARLITPEDFGLFGMVIAVTSFIAMFKDLGLSLATVQRKEITHPEVNALFWVNLGFGIGLTAIAAALAPFVAWFYGEPDLIWITIALSSAFVFGGLGVQHEALLRRTMKFRRIAIVEIIAIVASLSAAIALATTIGGYWALVAQAVILPVFVGIGMWFACDWRPGSPFGGPNIKELLKFGGNVTGFNLVNYFARNFDDILVGKVLGKAQLGYYQQAYKVLMVPLRQVNTPVSTVAITTLSKLVDEPERYRSVYQRITEKVLLVTTPIGVLMLAMPDVVIAVFLGDQWTAAGPIFAWLALLVFTQPIGNSTGWLFISQDRTEDLLKWGIVGSLLAVVSFIVGINWGAVGVAAAYSISGLLVRTPLVFWFVARKGPTRFRDFVTLVLPYWTAGLIASVTLYASRDWIAGLELGTSAQLTVTAIAGTLLTLLIIALFPQGRRSMGDLFRFIKEVRTQ